MRSRVFAAFLLSTGLVSGVTVEVVQVYQPLSLHGTDGIGEALEEGDPVQAAVMARPYALTGAVPEDLVKAVASPHRIVTNAEGYEVPDANLLNLCKIGLKAEVRQARLLVRLDVSSFEMPEEGDLTIRQALTFSIIAIQRTLEDYFQHVPGDPLEVSVGIKGTREGNETLKDLARRFRVGQDPSPGEDDAEP